MPGISALLDQTGEFRLRAQKRYDDTALLIAEMTEWGYDSERRRAALRQMNRIHGRFAIANDDYLYVLTTFIFEPIRWIDRFGWRGLSRHERLAQVQFWREVGRRMGIRDIPDTYIALEQYNVTYERERFRFCETNRRVEEATRDLFLSWFLAPLRPLLKPGIYALLEEPALDAFGFPHPPGWLRRLAAPAGGRQPAGAHPTALPAAQEATHIRSKAPPHLSAGLSDRRPGAAGLRRGACSYSWRRRRAR